MNDILLQEEKESGKEYKRTLWWVEHRDLLGKIGIVSLIVFDVCLVLFVSWSMIDSFLISAGAERKYLIEGVLSNQEDLHAYTVSRSAAPISISNVNVFPVGNDKYDFYTQLENPNAVWWAEFQYQFVFEGGVTEIKNGFILPTSTKPLIELAFSSKVGMQNAQLQFVAMNWHRLDRRAIPDYVKWSQDRLGLEIQNPTLVQDTSLDPRGIFRTTFTVMNKTAYSYYNPVFYLLMKRGTSVVSVNKISLQSLDSGESQDVVVNWFGTVGSGSQVQIYPDLNLFDLKSYKALEGAINFDSRSAAP